jgi:hypothetical protein
MHARRLALVGAALSAAVLVALIASGSGHDARATNRPSVESTTEYSVLMRPATAEDARFAAASDGLKVSARDSGLGIDPDGARVIKSKAGKSFAIVPATVAPCIVSEQDGVSCGIPSAPVTAQVGYGFAIGLAPDAVKNVSLTLTDGTTTTAPVVDNVWEAPDNAVSVTVTIGQRSETVGLMPAASLPAGAKVGSDGKVTIGTPGS